jgi:serine/threonine-protein kinase
VPEWTVPRFTRLRELGSGGFGEVALARHEASGTLVAIKYLRQSLLSDPEFSELFRNEAAVLAPLDDPNVVRLYGDRRGGRAPKRVTAPTGGGHRNG